MFLQWGALERSKLEPSQDIAFQGLTDNIRGQEDFK